MFAHRSARAALAFTLTFLLGCSATREQTDSSPLQPPAFGIPFPNDRVAAVLSDLNQNGKDALIRSAGAIEVGTALNLPSSAVGMEWAAYRFTPTPPVTLARAQVTFAVGLTDEAWIGIADYSTQRWEFTGPVNEITGPSNEVQTVSADSDKHLSPNGNVFIVVVCGRERHTQVNTLSLTIDVPAWGIADPNPDSAGGVGYYTSLAVVNGNPAMSYWDGGNSHLKYVRASNAAGSAWGAPLTLDSAGEVGSYCSLAIVNGFPAISYFDESNGDLKYVRATDANGSDWGAPQMLDSAGEVGYDTSLAVVNGFPAISYYDGTFPGPPDGGNLKYVRASNGDGSAWGSPQTLDSAGVVGSYTSLAVVNGFPAISYYDASNDDLKYVRASDVNGSAWNPPVIPDSAGDVGLSTSLTVVSGKPAISYWDSTNGDLKYVRATNPDGSAWGTPQTPDTAGDVGFYSALAVVNGFPAISYSDGTNRNLKYVRASNAAGSTWAVPQTLDSTGDVGLYTSLAEVDGFPAISYYDQTNEDLKYIRLN